MDDLNMLHVLAENVSFIGHGVRLTMQNATPSKTLVCYLDDQEEFHFGFAYKNGSNLRVICWEEGSRQNKATAKGSFVIAFHDQMTAKGFSAIDFNADDFMFDWFTEIQQDIARLELKALVDKQSEVNCLVEQLAALTIDQLKEVQLKIDELKNQ